VAALHKEDMTVIDPSLDVARTSLVDAPSDGRELAMLRHDIRGALQGLFGAIGQIETAALDADAREQIDRIAAAARSLSDLVGSVLGEPSDPAAEGSAPVVDMVRFLDYLRRRHAGAARERGLDLVVEAQGDLPDGLALDPLSLERIVDNLLGNAVKFTGSGSVRLTARREMSGAIAFHVVDGGPGLAGASPEAAPGSRPAPAPRPGHGLGLQIVRSLTERLGGTISLGNRPEGGAEAVLRFPAAAAVAVARRPAEPAAPDFTGLRVLLAEDNPTNQMVASQMLRSLHAEVSVCADGVEALEHFDRQPVDLVVVDIEMPRLSGLDVIRAIRSRGDVRSQVPIVALTAYAMHEHRERIAAAGANGLISKPITSVEALGRALAEHVAPPARSGGPGSATAPDGTDLAGPVIDRVTFDALCEAIGSETMAELLEKVISDLLGAQRDLAAALDPVERGPIRTASHILISVAGAVGAVRLQDCARALNAVAHADAPDRIADGVRRCLAEIDAAVAFARGQRGAT
jgi:two-component system, OmpR family, aerobic respiration control sensor histidine kinase ArcB